MTLEQIKQAVRNGHKVYWSTDNYEVILDSVGQWLIHSKCNDHYIGLAGHNGTKLNGREDQFYMKSYSCQKCGWHTDNEGGFCNSCRSYPTK